MTSGKAVFFSECNKSNEQTSGASASDVIATSEESFCNVLRIQLFATVAEKRGGAGEDRQWKLFWDGTGRNVPIYGRRLERVCSFSVARFSMIKAMPPKVAHEYQWKVGDICDVVFDGNGKWYPARVTELLEHYEYKVVFLDELGRNAQSRRT